MHRRQGFGQGAYLEKELNQSAACRFNYFRWWEVKTWKWVDQLQNCCFNRLWKFHWTFYEGLILKFYLPLAFPLFHRSCIWQAGWGDNGHPVSSWDCVWRHPVPHHPWRVRSHWLVSCSLSWLPSSNFSFLIGFYFILFFTTASFLPSLLHSFMSNCSSIEPSLWE